MADLPHHLDCLMSGLESGGLLGWGFGYPNVSIFRFQSDREVYRKDAGPSSRVMRMRAQ